MIIDRAAYQAMLDHLQQAVPHEGCGLLAGPTPPPCPRDTDGDGNCGFPACPYCGTSRRNAYQTTCDRWVPVPNTAEFRRVRFEMDPDALLDVWKALDAEGRRPWVNVHSHVRSTAVPSEVDIRYAVDPTLRHLVVSLAGTEPVAKLWRIEPDSRGGETLTRVHFQVFDLAEQDFSKGSWTTDLTRDVSVD